MAVIELTCISCPLGCPLKVETDGNGAVVQVTGNTCKRGEVYGKKEVTAPERTVTSTVKVEGGSAPPGERAHQDGHPQGEDLRLHGGHPGGEGPGPGAHWGRGGGERLRHRRGRCGHQGCGIREGACRGAGPFQKLSFVKRRT